MDEPVRASIAPPPWSRHPGVDLRAPNSRASSASPIHGPRGQAVDNLREVIHSRAVDNSRVDIHGPSTSAVGPQHPAAATNPTPVARRYPARKLRRTVLTGLSTLG